MHSSILSILFLIAFSSGALPLQGQEPAAAGEVSTSSCSKLPRSRFWRRAAACGAVAWGVAGIIVGIVAWRNERKSSPESRALVAAQRARDGFYTPGELSLEQQHTLESRIANTCFAGNPERGVDWLHDAQKKIYRSFCRWRLRKSAVLREFLVRPDEHSAEVFAKTAWVVSQIPELATPYYRDLRLKRMRPLLDRRMKSIKIDRGALIKTLATDRPYEMLAAIETLHNRLLHALSRYGTVSSCTKPSAFNKFFLEIDHTFIFRFKPHGMHQAVILKIPSLPYYKLQEWYRDDGWQGEEHSHFRGVDRVRVAAAIRASRGGSRVTAPYKCLARRPQSDGMPLDDTTAVVMSECIEQAGKPWPWTLDRADKNRIRDIAVEHQLPDLHPLNFMRSRGVWYLIDTERRHAKRRLTAKECCQHLWWLC